ncbi:proline racemase family protein [Georgenia subflava]|uniref:Proline racemase n=1 Tax=Georgenia subflava TaxID=1622177 RepID=A0A6N7EPU4_9MICO|nr:proline racemase family protein [Georgenia subflava]MPV39133.1 proline racemase [Georgenia subflava]
MAASFSVTTVDYHTGGEPFRIVTAGVPDIPGLSVADRRVTAQGSAEIDRYRQVLVQEPRGHADMYGGFLVPPDDDGAHLGVLFWHKDGYSTACGHGTIALGVWAVEHGVVPAAPDGDTDVVIDVPSGRVTARVHVTGGKVTGATFVNVPSWVVARGIEVATPLGTVVADVSYGGALYASVPASAFGLEVTPEHYGELIAAGRAVKWALNDSPAAQHPDDPRLSGIYGTILYDDLGRTPDGPHQRNVTVFADGEVDRSACGSGTSARLPLLVAEGRLGDGETLTHDSVVGTRFTARVREHVDVAGRAAVVPEVTGRASMTGEHRFVLADDDEVGTGFVLR